MVQLLHRRAFVALSAAMISGAATGLMPQDRRPTLDLHVHLFGTGDSGSGCRLSEKITNGLQFRSLKLLLGIERKGKTLDEGYVNVLVEQIKGSGLSKAAILGQDAVYDASGQPDWQRTSFHTPNEYVFKIAKQHAQIMIPCPGLNPQRRDALDELAKINALGAKVFKIHPPTQGVDVADRKFIPFFKKCADLKMIVMVHTGHEHSAPVLDKDLANPRRLELALDQGPTVVACHCGTGWPEDQPDQLPFFLQMLKRYPNLHGDTSVLGTPKRVRDFYRLLDDPLAPGRLLHGSDFPFPVLPSAFAERIGQADVDRLNKDSNWIRKDFGLKESLKIGRVSAERGYQLVVGNSV